MKFLHTSDWHIGRLFHSVSLLEDQRHMLDQMIELLTNESVHALIIAGDIYDRPIPPASAVELLNSFIRRVALDMQIPIILIPGNHDSAERLNFGSDLLRHSGLHILGNLATVHEPVVIENGNERTAFYGIPYNDPVHVRDVYTAEINTYDDAHRFLIGTGRNLEL